MATLFVTDMVPEDLYYKNYNSLHNYRWHFKQLVSGGGGAVPVIITVIFHSVVESKGV